MRWILLKLAVWHFGRARQLRDASHREIDKAAAIVNRYYPDALRKREEWPVPTSGEAHIPILIGKA